MSKFISLIKIISEKYPDMSVSKAYSYIEFVEEHYNKMSSLNQFSGQIIYRQEGDFIEDKKEQKLYDDTKEKSKFHYDIYNRLSTNINFELFEELRKNKNI